MTGLSSIEGKYVMVAGCHIGYLDMVVDPGASGHTLRGKVQAQRSHCKIPGTAFGNTVLVEYQHTVGRRHRHGEIRLHLIQESLSADHGHLHIAQRADYSHFLCHSGGDVHLLRAHIHRLVP